MIPEHQREQAGREAPPGIGGGEPPGLEGPDAPGDHREQPHAEGHAERQRAGHEPKRIGAPAGRHIWITLPIESSAASAIASLSVGCAWIARSTSSTVYSFSRATPSSWIISEA